MNLKAKLKSLLAMSFAVVLLTGCEADNVDPNRLGNPGGSSGSPTDTKNCQVPLGDTLCVLGGDNHPGGLVDVLIAEDGPLGPIAGAINIDALTSTLSDTLENDGELADLVTRLIEEGQLEEGLKVLLVGEDGSGNGALAETLGTLLLNNEEGQGLIALFGEEGIPGLVQALLIDGTSSDCQAPLGTLCLISGGGGDQLGLVDLLLTSDGALGTLSPYLSTQVTDEIVATLGDILESNGSLASLLEGLFQSGHLAEGLEVLLIGDPDRGVPSGLVAALSDTITGLGLTVNDILNYLGSILGTTP